MTAARLPRFTLVLASAGILLGAAACTSSGGSLPGAGSLSYDQVRSTAQEIGTGKAGACPFGLDLDKALRSAGIPGSVGPDPKDGTSLTGDVGEGRPPEPWPPSVSHPPAMPSIPATPPTAEISCGYKVDDTHVDIDLLAVPQNGTAFNLMLPRIQRVAGIGSDQIQQAAAEQPGAGRTKLVPGGKGTAAVARIAPRGAGDIVLVLSQEPDGGAPRPTLTGEPLRKAAEALAAQLK
ncbi:hypothetical protein [Kitasatospora sp. NPDC097643]|uniref:hypothetical protein n=1 Tax=Kitasatospora sp. NPDC097643 TaxID=3157230 RepID=UPI0033333D2D